MLISDPFFDTLHRRHPDVDLVVLPASPAAAASHLAGDDVLAETLTRVSEQARQIWALVVPESDSEPSAMWSYASDPGWVRASASVVSRRDDGFPVLVSLRHYLEGNGWRVLRPSGSVERVAGSLGDLQVTASYAEKAGVFVFSVMSVPIPVGLDRARHLVRAQAGER